MTADTARPAVDQDDVDQIAEALYDYLWGGGSLDESKDAEELARLALAVVADRLLPRDATHDTRAFHRTAGTGVEYACSTKDCIVTVTRTAHTATWSVPPLPEGVEGHFVGGRQ